MGGPNIEVPAPPTTVPQTTTPDFVVDGDDSSDDSHSLSEDEIKNGVELCARVLLGIVLSQGKNAMTVKIKDEQTGDNYALVLQKEA